MITVYIPNNFISERRYAVETLLHHYCSIEVDIVPRVGQIHYELSWDGKCIIIKDQFFGKTIVGQSYIASNRIPEQIIETTNTAFHHTLLLFGNEEFEQTGDHIISGLDIFAGAFFMLTRWEESLGLHEDLHGRFPAAQALVVRSGFILRPIVDEYVALIKIWLQQLGYTLPPEKDIYRVAPTCDVDMPFFWLRKPGWKVLLSEWLKNKKLATLKQTFQKIKAIEAGMEKDPYDQFEYMMSLAEKAGLTFDFNMLVGGISKYEGYYSITDRSIQKLVKAFHERKHRIGLHPSYNSFLDAKLIFEEKNILAKQAPSYITSSRQHYLRFSISATWRYLADAGIKEDSTLGYAAEPGFRCGTSKPFPVFDIALKKPLSIMEHPLLIMDVSLRYYKKYTPEQSIVLCEKIISEVKKHNGELVFLWHNSNLSEVEGWGEWRKVFECLFR